MLVLRRHEDQSILIGNDIRIVVLGGALPNGVSLGIDAPKTVPILREEAVLPSDTPLGIDFASTMLQDTGPNPRRVLGPSLAGTRR